MIAELQALPPIVGVPNQVQGGGLDPGLQLYPYPYVFRGNFDEVLLTIHQIPVPPHLHLRDSPLCTLAMYNLKKKNLRDLEVPH